MNKRIIKLYNVVIAFCIIFIMGAYVIEKPKHEDASQKDMSVQMIQPTSITTSKNGVVTYLFSVKKDNQDNEKCIAFFTDHQLVTAYNNQNKIIYELRSPGGICGKTTGNVFNQIPVRELETEIKINVTPVYPNLKHETPSFMFGKSDIIYKRIQQDSFGSLFICVLILGYSLALLCYCWYVRKQIGMNYSVLYFSLFGIVLGLWSLNSTKYMQILYSFHSLSSFVGYVLMMLLPIPFVGFLMDFYHTKHKKMGYMLCLCSLLVMLLCLSLQVFGIYEFKQTAFIVHAMILAAIAYFVIVLVERIKMTGFDSKVKSGCVGLILILVAVVIDLIIFYVVGTGNDLLGKLSFMIYLIVLGKENAGELGRRYDFKRKMNMYKEMATIDFLTGMKNRNAFEMFEQETLDFHGLTIVTFDLNNLKQCNDTKGHKAGDQYIADAAEIIRNVFEKRGICYRIGGDEFCVVLRNAGATEINSKFLYMDVLQEEYNESSIDIDMKIAYGYAIFDEGKDADFEDTRSRSDNNMYEKKKQIKANA